MAGPRAGLFWEKSACDRMIPFKHYLGCFAHFLAVFPKLFNEFGNLVES